MPNSSRRDHRPGRNRRPARTIMVVEIEDLPDDGTDEPYRRLTSADRLKLGSTW